MQPKHIGKLFAKIILIILAVIVLIAGAITALLFNSSFQEYLKKEALSALSRKLQTEVRLDSASISISSGSIALYGLEVDDRAGELMLHADTLYGEVNLWELLKKNIDINTVELYGTKANLYKVRQDSATNYQFVLDTFKKKETNTDSTKVTFNINNIEVNNTEVHWSVRTVKNSSLDATLSSAEFSKEDSLIDIETLKVKYQGVDASLGSVKFNTETYKTSFRELGAFDQKNAVSIDSIRYDSINSICIKGIHLFTEDTKNKFSVDSLNFNNLKTIRINGIHIITDNGKPRLNQINPNRGAFDPGHMNVNANVRLSIRSLKKDNVIINLDKVCGVDNASGLNVDSMSALITTDTKTASITNVFVKNHKTFVKIPLIKVNGLQGKKGAPLGSSVTFSTTKFYSYAILKDISKPFAPLLCNFTAPVECTAWASGTIDHVDFHDIYSCSPDKRLQIRAKGYIDKITQKEKTLAHFDILSMTAHKGIKKVLLSQFTYKKSMNGLLDGIGDIGFVGYIEIPYKQLKAKGTLYTGIGSTDFDFHLDSKIFYVQGNVSSDSLNLGKLIGNPNIGNLTFNASFKFDICGPRAAKILHRKLTPLPVGWVKGEAKEAHYRFMTLHDTYFDINSDGYNADGNVRMVRAFADYLCSFTFSDTNFPGSLHFKPSIKFHKLSKEAAERRQQRKAEKAERKAEKKAQKAAAKEAKAEEKAAAKDAKAAEKAATKEAKAAEKAKAKAEKEAIKEEKAAEAAKRKADKKAAKEEAKKAKAAAKEAAKQEASD